MATSRATLIIFVLLGVCLAFAACGHVADGAPAPARRRAAPRKHDPHPARLVGVWRMTWTRGEAYPPRMRWQEVVTLYGGGYAGERGRWECDERGTLWLGLGESRLGVALGPGGLSGGLIKSGDSLLWGEYEIRLEPWREGGP